MDVCRTDIFESSSRTKWRKLASQVEWLTGEGTTVREASHPAAPDEPTPCVNAPTDSVRVVALHRVPGTVTCAPELTHDGLLSLKFEENERAKTEHDVTHLGIKMGSNGFTLATSLTRY